MHAQPRLHGISSAACRRLGRPRSSLVAQRPGTRASRGTGRIHHLYEAAHVNSSCLLPNANSVDASARAYTALGCLCGRAGDAVPAGRHAPTPGAAMMALKCTQ